MSNKTVSIRLFAGILSILVLWNTTAESATIYVPDDYATIQGAVNAANPGDTIIVRDGTYIENVDVDQGQLTIKSVNGAEKTIVNAANEYDHVFEVTADYVDISGFTVKGATGYPIDITGGICLSYVKNCNVSSNIASGNLHGVYLKHSSSNTVSGNTAGTSFGGYNSYGIELYASSDNTLSGNNIYFNHHCGIRVSYSSRNVIVDNTVNSNISGSGIYLYDSPDSTLINNIMSDNRFNFGVFGYSLSAYTQNIDTSNTVNGKPIHYLIDKEELVINPLWNSGYLGIVNCTNITVKDLTITTNCEGLLLAYSTHSTVENVIASNNKCGIHLDHCSNITLSRNQANSNDNDGIYLRSSSNNTLNSNDTSSNRFHGIYLDNASDNILTANTVTSNSAGGNSYGIYIWRSSNNDIHLNNFVDNRENIWSNESINTWNSPVQENYIYNDNSYTNHLGNYWDDYTGTDADGDGIGDTPYSINGDNNIYPLMMPFENYEISTEPPPPVPFPGSGKGVWILRAWEKNRSVLINKLQSAGIEWVVIKCGDGDRLWKYGNPNAVGWVSDAIPAFHTAGIKVFGWHYLRADDNYWKRQGNPGEESEAAVSIQILNIEEIDGLIINAEEEYDATSEETSKREQATQYMLSIRESHPEAFIAYNTFARIKSHKYFPYVQFGTYCDAVMPMPYWKDRETTPTGEVNKMHLQWIEAYESWEDTPNRYAIKPIFPVGQSSNRLGTVFCSGSEIVEFCSALSDYGYADMSIFRYDMFTDEAWDAYSTCFGEFLIMAFCPVDLLITDPDGFQISKHTNQISGAIYLEFDSNHDGELDDVVAIRETLTGDYIIQVIPQDGILPTDTFSLKVVANGETVVLFEDVVIKDIPSQPYIIRSTGDEVLPIIPVTVDFNPDTLNPRSPSIWVTVYIELPVGHGYETEQIDITSLMLNGQVTAEVHPTEIGDYDEDSIPDLMIKFNRQEVADMLEPGVHMIQLTGQLSNGTLFAGNDTVRVLNRKSDETTEPEFDWAMTEEFIADMGENLQTIDDDAVDTGDDKDFDVEEAVGFMLFEAGEIINELSPESFNNEESSFELACALDDVFTMLDEGMYFEVVVILEGDILERMDGFTNIGEPDEDDWITSLEGQALLYPLVAETIELLESML